MELRADETRAEDDGGKGKSSSWGRVAQGGSVGSDRGERTLAEGSMTSL